MAKTKRATPPAKAKKAKKAKKATAKKAAPPKRSARPAKPVAKKPPKATAPKATRPSLPLPPPPPPPPQQRDELAAERDVGRLLRYGERFGAMKIDVRWLPVPLPIASTQIALCDPGAPRSWRELDRPAGGGAFRMMLAVACDAANAAAPERLAALVVHVGRPPIARWTVAHEKGQKRPRSAEQLPRIAVTTGWLAIVDAGQGSPGAIALPERPAATAAVAAPVEIPLTDGRRAFAVPCPDGAYAAYWAIDAADRPVCLVIDFDAFTQKEWRAKAPA
ncbi:MAG: hypothetical protein KIT31_12375 [Deltaproteobacteria bacterium]|nr:hypothetical protein [Deltaproteobacteria bacterium]